MKTQKRNHENTKGGKHERRGGGALSWLVFHWSLATDDWSLFL